MNGPMVSLVDVWKSLGETLRGYPAYQRYVKVGKEAQQVCTAKNPGFCTLTKRQKEEEHARVAIQLWKERAQS